jgi:hypothetical protein
MDAQTNKQSQQVSAGTKSGSPAPNMDAQTNTFVRE